MPWLWTQKDSCGRCLSCRGGAESCLQLSAWTGCTAELEKVSGDYDKRLPALSDRLDWLLGKVYCLLGAQDVTERKVKSMWPSVSLLVGTSNTARGYLRYIKLDYAALGVRIQEPVDVSLILSGEQLRNSR